MVISRTKYDVSNEEIALIRQELFSFPPTFSVERGGIEVASIVKEFTFFHQAYTVEGPDWQVEGDFSSHEYTISKGGQVIATVSREWFTLGDSYEINIRDARDEVMALATALVIDIVLAD